LLSADIDESYSRVSGSVSDIDKATRGKLIERLKTVVVRTDEVEERDGVLIRTRRKKCQRGALTKMIIVVEASSGYGGREGSIIKGGRKLNCRQVFVFLGGQICRAEGSNGNASARGKRDHTCSKKRESREKKRDV
jgi:hypothetical protein